ncbi:hypothetical protein V8C35DRAFT_320413 [Trichoderma chlorosporum]
MDGKNQKRQQGDQFLTETAEHVGKKPRIESYDTNNATTSFSGQGIQHTGQGSFSVGGNVTVTTTHVATTMERDDCLRSLFITDPSDDRTSLKRKKGNRASGTCEWILDTEEVAAWLGQGETTSNILWIYGNPGIGKSTMAIFLTEELSTIFNKTIGKTLAFFFCDSSFDKQKTATSIVRGLLLQLVQQHSRLLDHILPKFKERGPELFKSFDALWKIFITAAADQNIGQTYCIIDALDECDQESQDILLHQLNETFQNQHQNAPSNVRILITSRPYPEIREYLEVFINKDLASFFKISEDIDRYIKEKVAHLAIKKKYTKTVQQNVSDILREKAESTFLWIGLACEQLEKFLAKDAIRVLQEMPKGLHSLYKSLLDTALEGSEVNIIRRILGLVAVCLYEDEDMETRVQFTCDQIVSCCLMIISVKDYLAGGNSDNFINELEVYVDIAYRCVMFLMKKFHSGEQLHIPFLSYATENWADHARMAQSSFEVRDSEAEFFRLNSPAREQWLETLRRGRYSSIPSQFSILHVAAHWGIVALLDYTASSNYTESSTETIMSLSDFNCLDSDGKTPLEQAILRGHLNVIIKLLCSEEVIMTLLLTQRGDEICASEEMLAVIAQELNKELMELFLNKHGDKIHITDELVDDIAENSRHHNEIMKLLLEQQGDRINFSEETVISIAEMFNEEITITERVIEAAVRKHAGVMELLLDRRGNEITITENVVEAAARNLMELLLDRRGNEITITEEVVQAAASLVVIVRQRGYREVVAMFEQTRWST